MESRITSVADLPQWFKEKEYKKRLGKIDWFREVRMRQILARDRESSDDKSRLNGPASESYRELVMAVLTTRARPDSPIYFVSQHNRPVSDLTVSEAFYFRSAMRDECFVQLGDDLDALLALWLRAQKEPPNGPTPLFGEYELQLTKYVDAVDQRTYADKLDMPVVEFIDPVGDPWLSYGRPLNGYPITVDTQYDDESILVYFKEWLAQRRKIEGERLRRPIGQSDFDDWEYYKIREVFDLDTWARAMGVRILDKVIARALWPNPSDDFSPIDVLRTTARKKVREVFNYSVVARFHGQLVLEFGENFIEQ